MADLRLASMIAALALLAVGCGSSATPAAKAPLPSPSSAAALKPAVGKPLVTVLGLANSGKPLALDSASLDGLPVRTLTIVEPFVKKTMTFTGVSVAEMLSAVRATGVSITLHALDDYEATINLAALRDSGAIFATQADGKRLDIKAGGPIRLVFPASSALGKDNDLWVWSIDTISVS